MVNGKSNIFAFSRYIEDYKGKKTKPFLNILYLRRNFLSVYVEFTYFRRSLSGGTAVL